MIALTFAVLLVVTSSGAQALVVGYSPPTTPSQHALSATVHPNLPLTVRLQLMPQSLGSMLRRGVAVHVTSNQGANGFVTLSITRNAARRAHIRSGRRPTVAIGRGTVSRIKDGTVSLHLRLSPAISQRLGRLTLLKLTVRLVLVSADGRHVVLVAAASY